MTDIFNTHGRLPVRKLLRTRSTPAEQKLWYYLRGERLGCKFKRQYGIGGYIVDFCAPIHHLVVELDGGIHESLEAQEYDMLRQKEIEGLGFTVLRFPNAVILNSVQEVLKIIKNVLEAKTS